MIGHFLGGVGALIRNPNTDQYLLLRRSEQRDFKAGDWDCVTGRVDQGEGFQAAVHREVHEEIGAAVQIEFIIAITHFYRGKPIPQNELLGVIFECTLLPDSELRHSDEHSEMRWVTIDEVDQLLNEKHWLRKVIHKADRLHHMLPETLRVDFRREGFEL